MPPARSLRRADIHKPPAEGGTRCEVCGRVYLQFGRLRSHVSKLHPEAYDRFLEDLSNPEKATTLPPMPVGVIPNGVQRAIMEINPDPLYRQTLRTTIRAEEGDYDSTSEHGEDLAGSNHYNPTPLEFENSEIGEAPLYPPQHYPGDLYESPIEDQSNRAHLLDCDRRWHPFNSGWEFKMARYMLDNNLSMSAINQFFNEGYARSPPPDSNGNETECFTSSHTYSNLLDKMDPELSPESWQHGNVDHTGTGRIFFRFRVLETMIRHIFKQPSHEGYMVYRPVKEYHRKTGYRLLGELHTGDWWWRMQVRSVSQAVIAELTVFRRSWIRSTVRDDLSFHWFSVQTKHSRLISPVIKIYGH